MKPAVHSPSVWAASANPRPELPTLNEDIEAEVALIGGGCTGFSAAHHLSKAGIGCVVLEANDAGWGASGRNGGMAVLRYKKAYSTLAARYGGRGVALTNLLGKLLARMVRGEDVEAGPMVRNRFAPIPFHAWRIPGMKMVAGYFKLLDNLAR